MRAMGTWQQKELNKTKQKNEYKLPMAHFSLLEAFQNMLRN